MTSRNNISEANPYSKLFRIIKPDTAENALAEHNPLGGAVAYLHETNTHGGGLEDCHLSGAHQTAHSVEDAHPLVFKSPSEEQTYTTSTPCMNMLRPSVCTFLMCDVSHRIGSVE